MAPRCVVLGAGGHAKVAVAALQAGGWIVAAIHDDDASRQGGTLLGIQIAGGTAQALGLGLPLHLAIGSNNVRRRLSVAAPNAAWAKAIHPTARIDPTAAIGDGSLVGMGAMVQVDAAVGRHVIVNTGAIVEHDCQVGDFVHLAPGSKLAGGVRVGDGAMVGLGAQVLPGITVGAWATVGAGAVVTRDVADGQTVGGVPARALR